MNFTRAGVGELTKFHREVTEAALDFKTRLVLFDAVADTFGGDENNRGQVRQYVQRALLQIALKIDGAVLCNAHPSRAGLASGTGDSGSTGWSAAFRSRMYLHPPETEHGEPRDPDARVVERMKANYASRGAKLLLRWRKGVIIPEGVIRPGATAAGVVDAKPVFLSLLREFAEQNRPVSSKSRAGNYAPREFERLPPDQRLNFRKHDFERAMNVLFREKKIENVGYGRKGDERTQIIIREDSELV
jgi:RecA-family ATPase